MRISENFLLVVFCRLGLVIEDLVLEFGFLLVIEMMGLWCGRG